MAQLIKHKRSGVSGKAPILTDLALGELSINTHDGYIYIKQDSGTEKIVRFDPVEYGGLQWNTDTKYKNGDVVSYDSSTTGANDRNLFVSLVDNINRIPDVSNSFWLKIADKGTQFDASVQYDIGDIVSIGDQVYIIKEDPTNVGNPPPAGTLPGSPEWPDIPLEVGGIDWSLGQKYSIGDIISTDERIYICRREHTALTGNNIDGSPTAIGQTAWLSPKANNNFDSTFSYNEGDTIVVGDTIFIAETDIPAGGPIPSVATPGNWSQVTADERAGLLWDNSKQYQVGDLVTENGMTYVVTTTPGIGNAPSTNPAQFKNILDDQDQERGGVLWDVATAYKVGDIISDTGTPRRVHIALLDNIGFDPISNPIQWQELNSVWHEAEITPLFNPTGDTYPIIIGESLGAIFYVQGLGNDPVTGEKIKYTYTAGSLNGSTLKDEDKLIWVGGTTLNPTWLLSKSLESLPERGGTSWTVNLDYKTGDVVTEGARAYISVVEHTSVTGDTTLGSPTQLTQTSWIAVEKGGIFWKAGTTYVKGDSVTDDIVPPMATYLCTVDHNSTTGNGANGSPQQTASTNWTSNIVEDPGIF